MITEKNIKYEDLRKNREKENIDKVIYHIDHDIPLDKKINNKYVCNVKELNRVCELLGKTLPQVIEKCKNDIDFKMIFANSIKINPSRQGSLDEKKILEECHDELKQFGIKIKKLDLNEQIPVGDGMIKSRDQLSNDKIKEFKSFDGKICKKLNGYIIHKCCYGNGGHQDNVFIEAINLLPWIEKRLTKYKDEIYVFLFETNNKKLDQLRYNIQNNKKISNSTFVFNKNEFIDFCKSKVNKTNSAKSDDTKNTNCKVKKSSKEIIV
jgi:hypothetical protein